MGRAARALVVALPVVLVVLIGPFAGASAKAAERCAKVADPAGSDSAAGTDEQPFQSAQRLVDSLTPGEVGCLRGGVFSESVTIGHGGVPGAPLTLRPYPGEGVRLVGRLVVKKGANDVIVEGLFLDGRNAADLPSPTINADRVTFGGNDVTNAHQGICFVVGASNVGNSVAWGRAHATLIEGNRIHDCGRMPATNHEHGVYVEGADDTRISGNWIYDNADRGVQLYPDAQRTTVSANVIDGNGTGLVFSGEGGSASSDNLVTGNVITGSVLHPNVESWWGGARGRDNVLRGNCVGGPRDDGDGGISTADGGFKSLHNVIAQPRFVNRAGGDLRLERDSPCRTVYAGGDAVPGPGAPPSVSTPALRITVRPGTLRRGERLIVAGRADTTRVRPGRSVAIVVRGRGPARVVARRRVRPGGGFRATPRLHPDAPVVRVVAAVQGVARSRPVRVAIRG